LLEALRLHHGNVHLENPIPRTAIDPER
jgi:hypothetical protein